MKRIAIVILSLMMVGCAAKDTKRVWSHPSDQKEENFQDYKYECSKQANAIVGQRPQSDDPGIMEIYNDAWDREFANCMESKGWTYEKKKVEG